MFFDPAFDDAFTLDTRSLVLRAIRNIADFAGAILRYHRHRRDYRHLLSLPDYLLKDIGVTREEAAAALHRPFL